MKSFLISAASLVAARFAMPAEPAQTQAKALSAWGRVRQAGVALLVGSAFFAAPVAAQQAVVVDKTDTNTFRVRAHNLAKEPVRVRVVSMATGQNLFAETYDQAYYSCHLGFQNLKAGSYLLITKIGQDRYSYTIQVKPAAAGQTVAVRNVKIHLSKQSQQVAALNTLPPAVTVAPSLATK